MESFTERGPVAEGESVELEAPTRITGGVGDGASVRAARDLLIDGNVGAATIEAGGALTIDGGVVGKGRAVVRTGGSLNASFLDSSEVEVGKGLVIGKQALNCQMLVHGWIDSPEGMIIGGETRVMRAVRVRSLGSDSAVPTIIVLGTAPMLDDRLRALEALAKDNSSQLDRAKREMEKLSSPGLILKPADKERQTELTFEIQRMQSLFHRCEASLGLGREELRRARATDLSIMDRLYPAVVIEADSTAIAVDQEMAGPLRIIRDQRGNLVLESQSGGAGVPIKNVRDLRIVTPRRVRA